MRPDSGPMRHLSNPDVHAIAGRLRYAREKLALGSRELSTKAGLSVGTVSSLESGHVTRVELRTMLRLADALGVSRAWLCWGEGGAPPAAEDPQKSQ
jgi:transcriptional regulator with XRE-family HTH domain